MGGRRMLDLKEWYMGFSGPGWSKREVPEAYGHVTMTEA